MAIAPQLQLTADHSFSADTTDHVAATQQTPAVIAQPAPISNLASLLDQFTQSVTMPHAHTVGHFAQTVGALHGELAMLARHFGAEANALEEINFDDIFPDGAPEAGEPTGLAAEEELEQVCRELSR